MGGGWDHLYSPRRDFAKEAGGCFEMFFIIVLALGAIGFITMGIMWLTGYGYLLMKEPDDNSNVQQEIREVNKQRSTGE